MKLLLADDHMLFLEGLQYLLETYGVQVLGKARNGKEALLKARILKPDIILMDIRMPECDGLEALKLIKAELSDIKIIMLTTSEEDDDLFTAIKYGASGYLLKNTDANDLINMLKQIEKGEIPLSPGLAVKILKEFRRDRGAESINSTNEQMNIEGEYLTQRQLEILEMVARGITYKEAGEVLGLSERTVKYHMGRIIELLHLENKAQVISYVAKRGLFEKNK